MKGANRKLFILAALAVCCLALAPFLGAVIINPLEALDSGSPENLIFWRLRLPRAIGAFLAGAGLSICGLAFQALFRNPLFAFCQNDYILRASCIEGRDTYGK